MPRICNSAQKLVICLLVLFTPLAEARMNVVLLLSSDSTPYQSVAAGVNSVLSAKNTQYSLTTLVLDDLLEGRQLMPEKHRLLVTVGTRATQYALDEKLSETIFATFVTRNSLFSTLTPSQELPKQLKAVLVLDQPAHRIVALAQLINPRARYLGTAVNGASLNRLDELRSATEKAGLQMNSAILFAKSNPIVELKKIFSNSPVFVVVPDKANFNKKIAKWVLFLGYRYRVPVIGYSYKYAVAGALVSLFSTPAQIGRDTGERIHQELVHPERGTVKQQLFLPRYFTLALNDSVANSLALDLGSAEQLKQQLVNKLASDPLASKDRFIFLLGE